MAEKPLRPRAAGDAGGGRAGSTPRWVKVLGLVAIIVALLIALALTLGGGSHGPGRHTAAQGSEQISHVQESGSGPVGRGRDADRSADRR